MMTERNGDGPEATEGAATLDLAVLIERTSNRTLDLYQKMGGVARDMAAVLQNQNESRDERAEMRREMAAVRREQAEIRRELAEIRRENNENKTATGAVGAQVQHLRDSLHDARAQLKSFPDLVNDVAEQTGRHNLTELEKRLAEQKRDSYRVKLQETSRVTWAILGSVIVGVILATLGYVWSTIAKK